MLGDALWASAPMFLLQQETGNQGGSTCLSLSRDLSGATSASDQPFQAFTLIGLLLIEAWFRAT